MTKRITKLAFYVLSSFAVLFVLASCDKKNENEEIDENFEPVTINHAFGSTTITKKPERVATYAFGNQDIVLALDVVPVGFSAANFGVTESDNGMLPWTKAKLDELGAKNPNVFDDVAGINLEQIADSEPDIILAPYSGLTEDQYNNLKLIAPVIPYIESAWTIDWKSWIEVTAKALGLVEKGNQLISDIEDTIKTKSEKYPLISGKKVIWANFNANNLSQVGTYTPFDNRPKFLESLGLTYPESYKQLLGNSTSYGFKISAENAEVFNDADVVVGYVDDETWDAVREHEIWQTFKPFKNNAIARFGKNNYLAASGTATPLSILYTLDEYLNKINEALEKYSS